MTRSALLSLAVAVLLTAGGCGNDQEQGSGGRAATSPQTGTAPASVPTPSPDPGSRGDTAPPTATGTTRHLKAPPPSDAPIARTKAESVARSAAAREGRRQGVVAPLAAWRASCISEGDAPRARTWGCEIDNGNRCVGVVSVFVTARGAVAVRGLRLACGPRQTGPR